MNNILSLRETKLYQYGQYHRENYLKTIPEDSDVSTFVAKLLSLLKNSSDTI